MTPTSASLLLVESSSHSSSSSISKKTKIRPKQKPSASSPRFKSEHEFIGSSADNNKQQIKSSNVVAAGWHRTIEADDNDTQHVIYTNPIGI